jgi:hypothetical protein
MAVKYVDEFTHPADFGFTRSASPAPRGMARGGRADPDLAQDKALVVKGIRQHENAEHGGRHEPLKLAIGGTPRIPRAMKPQVARVVSPIGKMARAKQVKSPRMPKAPQVPQGNVNDAPMDPGMTRTPRNITPGGVVPYGIEPTPDGAPQMMRRGGKTKR